jgi:hypothetical protein
MVRDHNEFTRNYLIQYIEKSICKDFKFRIKAPVWDLIAREFFNNPIYIKLRFFNCIILCLIRNEIPKNL